MVTVARVFAFLFGLVFGSFANVLIHRVPRRESILSPGSHCPRCGRPIAWYNNVPVLSWLVLRGRCAECASPISPRYPLVELAMGVLFLATALRWSLPADVAAACLFCLFCVVLGLIDLEHRLLPDALTFPGIAAGMGLSFLVSWTSPVQSLAGAVAGALIPMVLLLMWQWVFRIEGMGWGDVKLLAMIGAFLGWKGLLLTLLAGSLGGALVGGLYIVMSGKGRRTELPFGTFLAAAALAALFVQTPVWTWYLGLMAPAGP